VWPDDEAKKVVSVSAAVGGGRPYPDLQMKSILTLVERP
jgi:hypothetical protein